MNFDKYCCEHEYIYKILVGDFMPYYDFYCVNCDETSEHNIPIAQREKKIECESCSQPLQREISSPAIGYDNFALTGKKPDEGFRDRLREIKKNVPGAHVNTF